MANVQQFPALFTATDASKPSTNVISGTLLYCADSNTLYVGSTTSTWQGPISSGSIASGQIAQYHLSSGAVNSGHFGNVSIASGSYSSGSIAAVHISSGTLVVQSGIILTQDDTKLLIGANFTVPVASSGIIQSGDIAPNAVVSGSIASGAVNPFNLASGTIQAAGGLGDSNGSFVGEIPDSGYVFFTYKDSTGICYGNIGITTIAGSVNYKLIGNDFNGVSGVPNDTVQNQVDINTQSWGTGGANLVNLPLTYVQLIAQNKSGNVNIAWSFVS